MARTKAPEAQVRSQLQAAGPEAVNFLVAAMKNEELPYKERIDIAKDLLNRGFGKSSVPPAEAPALRVVLAEEVKPYAD